MEATVEQAMTMLPDLLALVAQGEDVVLVRDGLPVARLAPLPVSKPRFGSARGLVTIADDFDEPLPEFEEYMR